jgi:DNA-directed RNA polymerase specialized sigma24 family protein
MVEAWVKSIETFGRPWHIRKRACINAGIDVVRKIIRTERRESPSELICEVHHRADWDFENRLIDRIALLGIVASLNERDRLWIIAECSLPNTEARAKALGVPVATYKVRLHRIRKRFLRKYPNGWESFATRDPSNLRTVWR